MRLRPARSPPPPVTGAARTGRRVSAGGGGDTCARSPTPRGPGAGQRGGQRAARRARTGRAEQSRAGGGRCAALGSAPPRERAGGGGGASPWAAGSAVRSGTAAQSPHGAVGRPRGCSASREFRKGCAERRLRYRPGARALAGLRQAVAPALAPDSGSARPLRAERPGRPVLRPSRGCPGPRGAEVPGGVRTLVRCSRLCHCPQGFRSWVTTGGGGSQWAS